MNNSTYNKSRKDLTHIYIMAQAIWEKEGYYEDADPAYGSQK